MTLDPTHHPTHLVLTGTPAFSPQMGHIHLQQQVWSLLKSSLGVTIQATPSSATPKSQASFPRPHRPGAGQRQILKPEHVASGGDRIPLPRSEGIQGGGRQTIKQFVLPIPSPQRLPYCPSGPSDGTLKHQPCPTPRPGRLHRSQSAIIRTISLVTPHVLSGPRQRRPEEKQGGLFWGLGVGQRGGQGTESGRAKAQLPKPFLISTSPLLAGPTPCPSGLHSPAAAG